MLKNILNLEGTQEITPSEQKTIVGINAKETASKCDAWHSIIAHEDCVEYYAENNFAGSN